MTDATKTPNYTEEQEAELRAAYMVAPTRETVNHLALSFGKTHRSIIAKLSNMGIYIAPPRTTKAGTPIVKKETLVKEICDKLGVDAPSLIKVNKQDLERLVLAVEGVDIDEVD